MEEQLGPVGLAGSQPAGSSLLFKTEKIKRQLFETALTITEKKTDQRVESTGGNQSGERAVTPGRSPFFSKWDCTTKRTRERLFRKVEAVLLFLA